MTAERFGRFFLLAMFAFAIGALEFVARRGGITSPVLYVAYGFLWSVSLVPLAIWQFPRTLPRFFGLFWLCLAVVFFLRSFTGFCS